MTTFKNYRMSEKLAGHITVNTYWLQQFGLNRPMSRSHEAKVLMGGIILECLGSNSF